MEAQAAVRFHAVPSAYPTLAPPPKLEQMLVGGSAANALLAMMFTSEQAPHQVIPLNFSAIQPSEGGGHRRMQKKGIWPRGCASR